MRNRLRCLAILILVLPFPARALTPAGPPLIFFENTEFCSFETELEVIATPKGAFEVVWIDEAQDSEVKGLRFGRNLLPDGAPASLLPLHGGLFFSDIEGTWAGRYEVAMNALDSGNHPSDPLTGYRVSLNLAGDPLAPTARFKPLRFHRVFPAAGGDSLQFRSEPPVFGPPNCRGLGLLAGRINGGGAPVSAENRVTRRATPWNGSYLAVDRLPNDTFIAAYSTCNGVVARRLNASGATVGAPVDLPLPGRIGNFSSDNLLVAAHSGTSFAVMAKVSHTSGTFGAYTRAVVNGQVFGPTLLSGIFDVVDLEASPSGGYLLLFRNSGSSNPDLRTLFVQELDARGVQRGEPLAVSGEGESGVDGALASLPDGRWIVVTRTQSGDATACSERVARTVLASD